MCRGRGYLGASVRLDRRRFSPRHSHEEFTAMLYLRPHETAMASEVLCEIDYRHLSTYIWYDLRYGILMTEYAVHA